MWMNSEYMMNVIGIISLLVIILLSIILALKMEGVKQLSSEVYKLKKALDEMDEQAKLIVSTDMELNKTQEELDKKVTGLYALQRLSRAISTTLEEKQIFKMIEAPYLEDLGFEKACGFLWNSKEKKFIFYLSIGYYEEEFRGISSFINEHKNIYLGIIKGEKTISTISLTADIFDEDTINKMFKVNSFVLSPILPQEGDKGFLFVGTEDAEVAITEGDEELINILTNQIGQSIENARLFEKTWSAHQELEKKVEERTRELTNVLNEVKKISRRKTDFISAVSHELRTPLTSIKGYAAILLTEKLGVLPEEVRNRLEKINRHSDELTHLVNDLLDISRIESGKMTMKLEFKSLKNIVANVSDLLSVQLKERQIEFISNIPENACDIMVDATQVNRVFINLIGNALKFSPTNGRISVNSHNLDDKQIQVDIIDTGCGIPKEAQELIFEEFYRVDNLINQSVKGTGLGLPLVKHIVEAHGGKIWVKSDGREGATFSFILPKA